MCYKRLIELLESIKDSTDIMLGTYGPIVGRYKYWVLCEKDRDTKAFYSWIHFEDKEAFFAALETSTSLQCIVYQENQPSSRWRRNHPGEWIITI